MVSSESDSSISTAYINPVAAGTTILNLTHPPSRQATWYIIVVQITWCNHGESAVVRKLMWFFCDYADDCLFLEIAPGSICLCLCFSALQFGFLGSQMRTDLNPFPKGTSASLASMSVEQPRMQYDALLQLLVFPGKMSTMWSFL